MPPLINSEDRGVKVVISVSVKWGEQVFFA